MRQVSLVAFGALLIAFAGVAAGALLFRDSGTLPRPLTTPSAEGTTARETGSCQDDAVARAVHGVVRLETALGTGSGFIDAAGRIVTAAHVVDGARAVTVTFQDGRSRVGTVGGYFGSLDAAIVSIPDSTDARRLAWGSSRGVQYGQTVYVIGYPLGTTGPAVLTKGVVSRAYTATSGDEYIQTDAALNLGNSGGPLINECGQVLGVVTLKRRGAEGISLALGADQIRSTALTAQTSAPSSVEPPPTLTAPNRAAFTPTFAPPTSVARAPVVVPQNNQPPPPTPTRFVYVTSTPIPPTATVTPAPPGPTPRPPGGTFASGRAPAQVVFDKYNVANVFCSGSFSFNVVDSSGEGVADGTPLAFWVSAGTVVGYQPGTQFGGWGSASYRAGPYVSGPVTLKVYAGNISGSMSFIVTGSSIC